METETLRAAGELDFSLIALFFRATLTVKIVMLILIFSSIWSWAIIIQKHLNFRNSVNQALDFEEVFWSGQPLEEVYDELEEDPRGGAEKIFVAGMREWRKSHDTEGMLIAGAQQRIDRAMNVAIAREQDEMGEDEARKRLARGIAPRRRRRLNRRGRACACRFHQ